MDTHQAPSPFSGEFSSRIREVYGSLDEPDFSFVQKAIDLRPYEDVIREDELEQSVPLKLFNTDPDDVLPWELR